MNFKKYIKENSEIIKNDFKNIGDVSMPDVYSDFIDTVFKNLTKEKNNLIKEIEALKIYCQYLQYQLGLKDAINQEIDTINEDTDTINEPERLKYHKKIRLDKELELIKLKKKINTDDLMNQFNTSKTTLKRDLKVLKKQGLIKYEVSKKTGFYIYVGKENDTLNL